MDDCSWVAAEFAAADLGDARRTARLHDLVATFAQRPTTSLPQTCADRAQLAAAYRFFDNPSVTPGAILYSHIDATLERCAAQPRVLAIQDTTLLDYSHHPGTFGLGPLATPQQQGFFLHATLACTPDRLPLGLLQEQTWARDPATIGKSALRTTLPITEKESYKWLASVAAVNAGAVECPDTTFVCIGDREADVYDLFLMERAPNVELLVRATQDRCTTDVEGKLWRSLAAAPEAIQVEVALPRRGEHAARTATLTVRWRGVELCPPTKREKEGLPTVVVGAVWAVEEAPPAGVEAVEWMLVGSEAVASAAAALERLRWYCARWGIEVWHKVLKSGCRIEARQLGSREQLERALAVYSVIAWRILYGCLLARVAPEIGCSVLLERAEWEALYCRIKGVATPPAVEPRLREAVRWIAQLGGFLGRKGDGEPGVTVLWRGWERLEDLTAMYRLLRPPPRAKVLRTG